MRYASDARVFFNAAWDGASDGAESFFIVGRETTVPEPGTLMLMSLGLVGLGLARRRSVAVRG